MNNTALAPGRTSIKYSAKLLIPSNPVKKSVLFIPTWKTFLTISVTRLSNKLLLLTRIHRCSDLSHISHLATKSLGFTIIFFLNFCFFSLPQVYHFFSWLINVFISNVTQCIYSSIFLLLVDNLNIFTL